ncbi:hypothetical protein RRG08_012996 [Elysia crispata]|uniref:Uncharacterized protein n=1 Tax=Elysia crispata TaxID=231223 RepID=A0AAE1DQN7_9GAST|nr:hypothetical protein RRG08_012996 [Elysia crispata]
MTEIRQIRSFHWLPYPPICACIFDKQHSVSVYGVEVPSKHQTSWPSDRDSTGSIFLVCLHGQALSTPRWAEDKHNKTMRKHA